MNNRKRVGDGTSFVDSFGERRVTVHYSSNRIVRSETGDKCTERRIKSVGG